MGKTIFPFPTMPKIYYIPPKEQCTSSEKSHRPGLNAYDVGLTIGKTLCNYPPNPVIRYDTIKLRPHLSKIFSVSFRFHALVMLNKRVARENETKRRRFCSSGDVAYSNPVTND